MTKKAKVKPILEARDQKMRDLRGDTGLTPEDRRAKMKALRDDMVTQMKAVLTPEQFDKWQKMSSAGMRDRRNGPPPGGGHAGGTNASLRRSAATIICGVTFIDTGTALRRPFFISPA